MAALVLTRAVKPRRACLHLPFLSLAPCLSNLLHNGDTGRGAGRVSREERGWARGGAREKVSGCVGCNSRDGCSGKRISLYILEGSAQS